MIWILLISFWSVSNPTYAGAYKTQADCEFAGHRIDRIYGHERDFFNCIEVPEEK